MSLKKSYVWMLVAAVVVVAVAMRFSPQTVPSLLIVLVCPVAMFIMMRSMHQAASDQGQRQGGDHAGHFGEREADEARR